MESSLMSGGTRARRAILPLARALVVLALLISFLPLHALVYAQDAGILAIGVDFRQCANDAQPGLGNCKWINSILQANNSVYYEGMGVPQRAIFRNIPATPGDVHSLDFEHQATKGGTPKVHAYDWLVSWDQAIALAADAGVDYNDLWGQVCDQNLEAPAEPICNLLKPSVNANCVEVVVPDDPYVSKVYGFDGGSYQDRIDAFEGDYGDRTVMLCGNAEITSPVLTLEHSRTNDGTADDYILYTLSWTSTSTEVMLLVAGHLSLSTNELPGWGDGRGSSNISGGPYHFKLSELDGISLGSQDNQIKGADIRLEPAQKSGHKWHDLDADGVWDDGEPGLPGWKIWVDYNDSGVVNPGEPSDITDETGYYEIMGINEGTYRIHEKAPPGETGWNCSFPATTDEHGCYQSETFVRGEIYPDNDFGNYKDVSQIVVKYHDLDADGSMDGDEPALNGWEFFIDTNADETWQPGETKQTTASGSTTFVLKPGASYSICEVLQADWFNSDPAGATLCESTGAVVSGTPLDTMYFGNWTTATKSGMKFEDLNANGVKDAGEPGLPGWTIYVDYNNSGGMDAGEPSATTGALGAYTINGIKPGTYRVREVTQPSWTCSFPASCYHQETFISGGAIRDNDFGNWRPATKSGYKWHDMNRDTQWGAGEPGLNGWTIQLLNAQGVVLQSTITANDAGGHPGYYQFTGLVPGTYIVKEVCPPAWNQSYPAPSGVVCGSGVHQVTLVSGQVDTDNNFGNFQAEVPEASTLILLGSGLAGLAGYASLQIRARRRKS